MNVTPNNTRTTVTYREFTQASTDSQSNSPQPMGSVSAGGWNNSQPTLFGGTPNQSTTQRGLFGGGFQPQQSQPNHTGPSGTNAQWPPWPPEPMPTFAGVEEIYNPRPFGNEGMEQETNQTTNSRLFGNDVPTPVQPFRQPQENSQNSGGGLNNMKQINDPRPLGGRQPNETCPQTSSQSSGPFGQTHQSNQNSEGPFGDTRSTSLFGGTTTTQQSGNQGLFGNNSQSSGPYSSAQQTNQCSGGHFGNEGQQNSTRSSSLFGHVNQQSGQNSGILFASANHPSTQNQQNFGRPFGDARSTSRFGGTTQQSGNQGLFGNISQSSGPYSSAQQTNQHFGEWPSGRYARAANQQQSTQDQNSGRLPARSTSFFGGANQQREDQYQQTNQNVGSLDSLVGQDSGSFGVGFSSRRQRFVPSRQRCDCTGNPQGNRRNVLTEKLDSLRKKGVDLDTDCSKSHICPITQDIMTDPVVAADGFTYERSAIQKWIQTCRRCQSPTTMEILEHRQLTPNKIMKSEISTFLDAKAREHGCQ